VGAVVKAKHTASL